jgi:hypothetical protein
MFLFLLSCWGGDVHISESLLDFDSKSLGLGDQFFGHTLMSETEIENKRRDVHGVLVSLLADQLSGQFIFFWVGQKS